ncbi:MAG: SGNH/GDSL hydrolase family protein [Proteobacteria bacterium]|nr:SGNH/GDSL hydrolase family protein [Pseudomonadota bacterium]
MQFFSHLSAATSMFLIGALPCLVLGCQSAPSTVRAPVTDDTGTRIDDPQPGDDDDTPYGPALYPDAQLHSPITTYVINTLQDIASVSPNTSDKVFIKIGDSHTVSSSALHCFAGDNVDLDIHHDLQPTLDHFLGGDADGETPFERHSEAAEGGMSSNWVIGGNPSPLDTEIAALNPSFALIQFGTNDMEMGITHASSMWGYYENMTVLLDQCLDGGIIPVLMGIPHRGDDTEAGWWVRPYNDIIRGLAQTRQTPFIDLYLALDQVAGDGLAGDGVHLNTAPQGSCQMTADGLEYGNNVRNLAWLSALDRVLTAIDGDPLDPTEEVLVGDGSPEDPFEIPQLPFSDFRDTSSSPNSNFDLYSGCGSDSDESGPEVMYRLELTERTAFRAIVLDEADVDIDIHLLDDKATAEGCLQRAHHYVAATLDPGTYHLVLDTYVKDGIPQSGEYMLVVSLCHPDDPCE